MQPTRFPDQWPPGGDAMAQVIRDTAWNQTALGAIASWTPALRMAVTTALDSPLPTILLWGPDLIQIYNSAYRHVLGERHPVAMGQATRLCWPEVWAFNEPIYLGVLGGGAAVHLEDQEYVIEPSGVRESRFFTVTYAPARDQHGVVHGVLVAATETTRRVLAERDNARLLRQSRAGMQQLQEMFDQTPSFIAYLREPEHILTVANAAYLRLAGRGDIRGMTISAAIPEAANQGFIALLDEVYRSGEAFVASAMPISLPSEPGGAHRERFLDFVYQPIRNGAGEVDAIFVEGIDVTEQHHQRQALQEKIRLLEQAERRQTFQLELSDCLRAERPHNDAVAACELLGLFLDVDGVVFCEVDEAQARFRVRCEYQRAGTGSASELRPLDRFGAERIAVLRAGAVFICDDTAADSRTRAHAAAYAEAGIRASLAIPLVRHGRLTSILNVQSKAPHHWTDEEVGLARDMAERCWSAVETTRAQAELRQERDKSQYVFDNMTEGFAMLDLNWCVTQMNAEGLRLSHRSAAEVIGKNHWEVWPEVVGSNIDTVYRRVRATGDAQTLEQFVTLSDAGGAWLEVRVQRAQGGELAVFYHDISERKAVEITLRDVARQKDEFLAMLAHELRNPLAPICAAADLLATAACDAAREQKIGAVIKRQAAHMTGLIQDLLDVSRVTQGFVTLEKVALDFKSVVSEAVEQVRTLFEKQGHQLTVQLVQESAWVSGDKVRLVQVLSNLLGNACKYTPDRGRIELVLEASASHLILTVTDDGIGMSPSLVERAFDLFSQAERTPDRVQGGLGIGLALVKSLVGLHNETVSANSEGARSGSRFTVMLPRLQRKMPAVPPVAGLSGGGTDASAAERLRVLVVDDNIDAAEMLGMVLSASGLEVAVEFYSRNALDAAQRLLPDVCILDLGLPDMDGYELARRLAAMPALRRMVLIAVTGYGQPQDRADALAAGFHHHFAKPVDSMTLISLLADIGAGR